MVVQIVQHLCICLRAHPAPSKQNPVAAVWCPPPCARHRSYRCLVVPRCQWLRILLPPLPRPSFLAAGIGGGGDSVGRTIPRKFFASAPGFVREEKERAAVLRQQASVRRRRAKEMAAVVAAQGAPGGSCGDGGGGLMSAEAESSPVGMEVEAAPLANWGGGSENGGTGSGGGSGSGGTLSGSCSKTAADGGGGGVRRPLSVVDEGERNHRQRNEPSAVVTPPPPLTVGHATHAGGLSSSVSSQPASDNAARDCSGEARFSSSEGTNGEAPVGQLVGGVYRDRGRGAVGCGSSGSGSGGGGGGVGRRRSAGVQEEGDDSDVVDLTAMDVVLTQEHEEESAASLMYDMMM